MKKRKIIASVISDLVTDQRVDKVCHFLYEHNYDVTLIGRSFKHSLPVDSRTYKTERISCFFKKGILAYLEFNIKLFYKLSFKKTDWLLSNDLDTLLPNFIQAKLRRKQLVYDSHEYFTGVPELQNSKLKKNIWQTLERLLLPQIKKSYTVNYSIANLYEKNYGIKMKVVRNIPLLLNTKGIVAPKHFPDGRTILLLQGAGINKGRGGEELIQSMEILPDNFLLVFIGSGDSWEKLKQMTITMKLSNKVWFIEKVPFRMLKSYTQQAHLGLSMDKPFCKNYELSLPNKIFDYIHAGIPILASNIVEVKNILHEFKIGTTVDEVTPIKIAEKVLEIFSNHQVYDTWKQNTRNAATILCWQKEKQKLADIYNVE